jgi:hypothetical protein
MFDEICAHGRCENQRGDFLCFCDPGYILDESGGNCTDINECEDQQSCLFGECTNTEGSFICSCPTGFQLLEGGHGCVDRREGACYAELQEAGGRSECGRRLGEGVGRSACCCGAGRAWGPECLPCPGPGTEDYGLVCPGGRGFQPNQQTIILEDINECAALPNLCAHGRCSNTFGNFMCSCKTGYRLDNTTMRCLDVDECSSGPELCAPGTCQNTAGGFQCSCPADYVLSSDGTKCIDMRREPCYLGPRGPAECSAPMSRPQTRLVCCCSMGAAWGDRCGACPSQVTSHPLHYGLWGRDSFMVEPMPSLSYSAQCLSQLNIPKLDIHSVHD